jgi:phospholipid/cholesterol/gamma-HCH transport system ATP-binding protein
MQKTETDKRQIVLEISDLWKSFESNHVLRGVGLQLHQGENLVVLGKSGSGKSVLIKLIIGLMEPDKGVIRVFGKNIPDLKQSELDEIRTRIGFLFQSNALYDSMTVRENLEFPLRRHRKKLKQEEVNNLIEEVLSNVGLAHTKDMMPSELSGGMKKRIALARTLILKPEIILYDEPTTGLDPVTSREISNLMLDIQRKYNTSSIIIAHDMSCVHITANRIITLVDGTCYAVGTWDELRNSSDIKVKQFFE